MKKWLGILLFSIAVILGFGFVLFKMSGNNLESVLEGIILLIYVLPPVIFIAALVFGIFGGFNILLPIITAALSVGFMFYVNGNGSVNAEMFIIPLIASVIALIGNAIGRIFYRNKNK